MEWLENTIRIETVTEHKYHNICSFFFFFLSYWYPNLSSLSLADCDWRQTWMKQIII